MKLTPLFTRIPEILAKQLERERKELSRQNGYKVSKQELVTAKLKKPL